MALNTSHLITHRFPGFYGLQYGVTQENYCY